MQTKLSHRICRCHCLVGLRDGSRSGSASLNRPVLVSSPALARHRPVQRWVEVRRGVGSRVPRRDRLRHEVRLIPSGLPVDFTQLLVLPHREQNLSGEFDDPGCEPVALPRHRHQSVDAAGFQQGPKRWSLFDYRRIIQAWCYKTYFWENLDFQKFNLIPKSAYSDSWTRTKWRKIMLSKQNYAL